MMGGARGMCAWCAGPLPAPSDLVAIRHPADGMPVEVCGARCLAAWVQHGIDVFRRAPEVDLGALAHLLARAGKLIETLHGPDRTVADALGAVLDALGRAAGGEPERATADRGRAFRAARTRGGLCAGCGRTLAEGEPVWLEHRRVPDDPEAVLRAPVGRECAAPAFLARTEGQDAERCASCGRGVYYDSANAGRGRALCSKRCGNRVVTARRQSAIERPG
jgi:hypothetical protein